MNQRLKKVLGLPLHRELGVTSIVSVDGRGTMDVTVNGKMVNVNGILHGGVVYLLCDVCAYGGLVSMLDDDTEAVTHDIHVSVMKSAREGDRVTFTSEVVRFGRTICFIDVKAAVGDQVIASARITKSILTRKA
jgi:uncharacterized protein (TIGR00369 family)